MLLRFLLLCMPVIVIGCKSDGDVPQFRSDITITDVQIYETWKFYSYLEEGIRNVKMQIGEDKFDQLVDEERERELQRRRNLPAKHPMDVDYAPEVNGKRITGKWEAI